MQVLMSREAVHRSLRRIAAEIVERVGDPQQLMLVGIRRGGVPLAERLAAEIASTQRAAVPVGSVDIALYRDDAATALPDPKIGPSRIPEEVAGRHVVLVDDVLQTGRTVRAAIECLLDYGRPERVWLAVLCDRGGRELPIGADFVGEILDVDPALHVEARVGDDGEGEVVARDPGPRGPTEGR